MKKFVLLFVVLLLSMSLFAKWSIGQVVDDFDDPTGKEFVYTLTVGTFSNSVTSNSIAYIRVLAEFSDDPYPDEIWTFEIHDYNWTNPIDEYYDDSSATIKIKDDNGKVTTFTKSNSEIAHTWNTLKASDGFKFTQLIKDNDKLKVSVTIENSKYIFTIDCSNFTEIFNQVYSNSKSKIGLWEYDEYPNFLIEVEKHYKDSYKNMGIDKYYPIGHYNYYGEQLINNQWYLFFFNMDNEYYNTDNYISIDFKLSNIEKSNSRNVTTDIGPDQVKEIYLIAGQEQKKMRLYDTVYTWSCSESAQDIVDKMASNKSSGIRVVLKNGKSLTFNFDGTEFAKVYEEAKKIELF